MTGRQIPEDEEHATELRVARDPDTSLDQLHELERSEYDDVRLAVGANYSFRLARHLLARHLANGAHAQVEMTNQYGCRDGIHLSIPIGEEDEQWSWLLRLCDPYLNDEYLDSQLFSEIVTQRAPAGTPLWSEFRFSNPLPDWDDIENMMEGEGFQELTDASPSWPQPLNGHDFHVWALTLLHLAGAQVTNEDGIRFLRDQEGLQIVGTVDINLMPEATQDSPHVGTDDLQHMIRFLRTDTIRSSSDAYFSNIGQWARHILEPLITAHPQTEIDILMAIAEDPTCPAMNIMRIAPWLPEDLRAFAALGSPDALYGTLWEPAPRSAPDVDRHKMPPDPLDDASPTTPDSLLFATLDSSAGDKSPASDLARLLDQIDDLVPDWMLEDDEESIGFLLERHNVLHQCCFWLRRDPRYDSGDIGISAGLAEHWISSLSLLVEALGQGADYSRIETLAFESWMSEDEIQALHLATEIKSLIEKAQDDFLARDYEGSRAAAGAAVELGSNEALYLSAIIESLLGEREAHEVTLVKAAAAGIVHATGELGSLECARGEYSAAIDHLTGIPESQRNVSVWVALSWALLVWDRSAEYLDERGVEWDEDRLKSVLDEPPLFEKFWLWHEYQQIAFVANHLACAVLNRKLTAYESAVLDAYLKSFDGVSEIILIAAYIAQSEGNVQRRDQLLGRLTLDEAQRLREEVASALEHSPSGSRSEAYFASLDALLDLKEDGIPAYQVTSDPTSPQAAIVQDFVAFASATAVINVRDHVHESLGLSEFRFTARYPTTDGSVLEFNFGNDHGNSDPDIQVGITSDWLYWWLRTWPHATWEEIDLPNPHLRYELRSMGWDARNTDLSILALLTAQDLALTEVGRTALADWFIHHSEGRENYVVYGLCSSPGQNRFNRDDEYLDAKLEFCWEQTSSSNPELAQVLVGPLLMLLPDTSDSLKMRILQEGVPDAILIARTHHNMSEAVRVTAALTDEQGLRSNTQRPHDLGSVTPVPSYALQEDWDPEEWLSLFTPEGQALILSACKRLPETSVTSKAAPDYSKSSGQPFPSFNDLGDLVKSGDDCRVFHRDIVLGALLAEEWITVSAQVRDQIQDTLQSLVTEVSQEEVNDMVLQSWSDALQNWG